MKLGATVRFAAGKALRRMREAAEARAREWEAQERDWPWAFRKRPPAAPSGDLTKSGRP